MSGLQHFLRIYGLEGGAPEEAGAWRGRRGRGSSNQVTAGNDSYDSIRQMYDSTAYDSYDSYDSLSQGSDAREFR